MRYWWGELVDAPSRRLCVLEAISQRNRPHIGRALKGELDTNRSSLRHCQCCSMLSARGLIRSHSIRNGEHRALSAVTAARPHSPTLSIAASSTHSLCPASSPHSPAQYGAVLGRAASTDGRTEAAARNKRGQHRRKTGWKHDTTTHREGHTRHDRSQRGPRARDTILSLPPTDWAAGRGLHRQPATTTVQTTQPGLPTHHASPHHTPTHPHTETHTGPHPIRPLPIPHSNPTHSHFLLSFHLPHVPARRD